MSEGGGNMKTGGGVLSAEWRNRKCGLAKTTPDCMIVHRRAIANRIQTNTRIMGDTITCLGWVQDRCGG